MFNIDNEVGVNEVQKEQLKTENLEWRTCPPFVWQIVVGYLMLAIRCWMLDTRC